MSETGNSSKSKRHRGRKKREAGGLPLADGACCKCGLVGRLVGLVMLSKKHPSPSCGWGCVACDLEPGGAIALLCPACCDAWDRGERDLLLACAGLLADPARVPFDSLTGEYRHKRECHPEIEVGDPG